MTIKELQKAVHENAVKHGWWKTPPTEGELLILIVSEVCEAFEEIRNGHEMTETYYTGKDNKMEGVPSELADVVIRVMDVCEHYGIAWRRQLSKSTTTTKPARISTAAKNFNIAGDEI